MRPLATRAVLCLVLAAPGVASAQIETQASADVYVSGGYSDNPFGGSGADGGTAFGQAGVRPKVDLITARSTFTLGGDFSYQEYSRRYTEKDNYNGYLIYAGKPSEYISTSARVSYDDKVVGSIKDVFDPLDPDGPLTGDDFGLFGTQDRKRAFLARGGLSAILSARDSLNFGSYFGMTRYSRATGDYDTYGGSLGYSRRLSENTQIGLQGAVGFSDYYQGSRGNTRVYSIQATGSTRLDPTWTLKGALGVSVIEDRGLNTTSTALSGNVQLCHQGSRSDLCLLASRAALPSGVAGTKLQTNVEANYSYRVTEHGRLSFRGTYAKIERGSTGFTGRNQYLLGSVSYDRRLSERLNISSSVFYRSVFGGSPGSDDFGGQVGLVYRIGDTR